MIIYKLGSLEHNIIPTKEAFEKLKQAFLDNPRTLVWSPDLEVEVIAEEDAQTHVILNVQKVSDWLEDFDENAAMPQPKSLYDQKAQELLELIFGDNND